MSRPHPYPLISDADAEAIAIAYFLSDRKQIPWLGMLVDEYCDMHGIYPTKKTTHPRAEVWVTCDEKILKLEMQYGRRA